MEASVRSTPAVQTIAQLIPYAAGEYAERPATRFKRDGSWHDLSYAELGEIVQEVGLGLIDLGIEAGERVCILANTRPEWSYADMGATSAAPWWCPSTRPTRPRSACG